MEPNVTFQPNNLLTGSPDSVCVGIDANISNARARSRKRNGKTASARADIENAVAGRWGHYFNQRRAPRLFPRHRRNGEIVKRRQRAMAERRRVRISSTGPRRAAHSFKPRNRNALPMTDTDEKLIAAAAIIGLSSRPKTGYRTPAATGTPSAL